MDGWFEVDDEVVDHAEAAFQRWQRDTKHPEPGIAPRVINTKAYGDAPRPRARPARGSRADHTLGDQPDKSRLVEGALGD